MANGDVLGNVNDIGQDVTWYLLENGDVVSFHEAYEVHPAKGESKVTTFYSNNETYASVTARKLGIEFAFITNAADERAERYIRDNDLKVLERINV